jgi:CRP-like cAMP-binding protein
MRPQARTTRERSSPRPPRRTERNRLLASLPRREYDLLAPHFEYLTLKAGQLLCEPGRGMKSVYFPDDCVCSLACDPVGGRPVEVGMIGREGFVGIDAVRGVPTVVTRCLVQTTGTATRVPARIFRDLAYEREPLRRVVAMQAQAQYDLTSLAAACNSLHSPRERFARWLLMIRDRVDSDDFVLTQEIIASMLGTARQTVSGVVQDLARIEAIEHRRGRVRIIDRGGLQSLACDCYRVIFDRLRELLGD